MMNFEKELEKEREKLNRMIEVHGYQLNNHIILKQSMKVDNLIVIYQNIKYHVIKAYEYKENRFVKTN